MAALSPIAFVVLMETLEAISMTGALPDIPDAVGLPWIPTVVGVVMAIGLVVLVIGAIVVG